MLMFQMETNRLDQASTRIRLGERVGSWSPIEGGAAFSTGSIGPQPSRPRRSIGLTVTLTTKFGQAKRMSAFHQKGTLAPNVCFRPIADLSLKALGQTIRPLHAMQRVHMQRYRKRIGLFELSSPHNSSP